MVFSSYEFLFLFLPVCLAGYFTLGRLAGSGAARLWLILASLAFYAWWSATFLLILIGSCLLNAALGWHLSQPAGAAVHRKPALVFGIVFNLGMLGYFKYANFFVASFSTAFGLQYSIAAIALPLGISFFVFQKIAFLVDAYNGRVRNFTLVNFILFVFFFPQLIAGPIIHHRQFMPQMTDRIGRFSPFDFAVGLAIFAFGLFKKVVCADSVAPWANAAFDAAAGGVVLPPSEAWIGALAYTFQLYFDFSGYSDMAVGLARMMGIRLPVNFNSPYKSASIIEFWRRWHITLSRFLRDYLYIPLGGNRTGVARRFVNLAIVMLLGGLWHGAGLTFVLWGALHGGMLIVNHGWVALRQRLGIPATGIAYRGVAIALTFLCVIMAWVVFRAPDVTTALSVWKSMLGLHQESLLQSWTATASRLLQQVDDLWVLAVDFYTGNMRPVYIFAQRVRFNPDLRDIGPPGLVLIVLYFYAVAIFCLPNVTQLMGRYRPALNVAAPVLPRNRSWRMTAAWACLTAIMIVTAVWRLSAVSPFLYFNF